MSVLLQLSIGVQDIFCHSGQYLSINARYRHHCHTLLPNSMSNDYCCTKEMHFNSTATSCQGSMMAATDELTVAAGLICIKLDMQHCLRPMELWMSTGCRRGLFQMHTKAGR